MRSKALKHLAPLEVKLASESGEITGYGSVFGNVDAYGDVVAPGAFAKTLAEHADENSMPAMLWQHNADWPIGTWTKAEEDAKGLLLSGRLNMETQRGAEARALARQGASLGLSIGYRPRGEEDEDGTRVLTEVELWEVSLVTFPANRAARITDVKSLHADEIRTAIQYERFLKAHGFPNSLARRLAGGWNAAVGRSDEDAERLLAAVRASTAQLTRS